MMATQHPSNNRVLGAPAGVSQEDLPCRDAAVTDLVYCGVQAVATFWEPSPEERAQIAAGAHVVLIIPGYTMPPAAIEVAL